MLTKWKEIGAVTAVVASLALSAVVARAQVPSPVAAYTFQNTLAAQQPTAPALQAVDPEAENGFATDNVFGVTQSVYSFAGANSPATDQAGLTVDTTNLLTENNYTAEMWFKLNERDGAWRRVLDVQDRQSDDGLYINPSNQLDLYPDSGTSVTFTTGQYYSMVMSESSAGVVKGYLDGVLQFTDNDTQMDIANANNPGNLMGFFLDNTAGSGIGEWSSGSIGLLRLYNSVLTDTQVASLSPVPTPDSAVVLALGALPLLSAVRRGGHNRG